MYPKINRATKADISLVKAKGKVYRSGHLGVAYLVTQANTNPKFAIIVSTKVSKRAVDRNAIKRVLRAALITNLPKMKKGIVLLILTNKKTLLVNTATATEEIATMLRQTKLML